MSPQIGSLPSHASNKAAIPSIIRLTESFQTQNMRDSAKPTKAWSRHRSTPAQQPMTYALLLKGSPSGRNPRVPGNWAGLTFARRALKNSAQIEQGHTEGENNLGSRAKSDMWQCLRLGRNHGPSPARQARTIDRHQNRETKSKINEKKKKKKGGGGGQVNKEGAGLTLVG